MIFFFKQKTAYEMRISDWSSDVCSSDLTGKRRVGIKTAAKDAVQHTVGTGLCIETGGQLLVVEGRLQRHAAPRERRLLAAREHLQRARRDPQLCLAADAAPGPAVTRGFAIAPKHGIAAGGEKGWPYGEI